MSRPERLITQVTMLCMVLLALAFPPSAQAAGWSHPGVGLLAARDAQVRRLDRFQLIGKLEGPRATDVRLLEGVDLGGGDGVNREAVRTGLTLTGAALAGVIGAVVGGIGGGIAGVVLSFAWLGPYAIVGLVILPVLGLAAGAVVVGGLTLIIAGSLFTLVAPPTAQQTLGAPQSEEDTGPEGGPKSGPLSAKASQPMLPRNTLNTSPVAAAFGFFSVEYERVVAPHWSLFAAPVVGTTSTFSFEPGARDSEYELEVNMGARAFVTPSAPVGFFIQPQIHVGYFHFAADPTVHLQTGFGAQVGASWLLWNWLDVSLGAGAAGVASMQPGVANSSVTWGWIPLLRGNLGVAF